MSFMDTVRNIKEKLSGASTAATPKQQFKEDATTYASEKYVEAKENIKAVKEKKVNPWRAMFGSGNTRDRDKLSEQADTARQYAKEKVDTRKYEKYTEAEANKFAPTTAREKGREIRENITGFIQNQYGKVRNAAVTTKNKVVASGMKKASAANQNIIVQKAKYVGNKIIQESTPLVQKTATAIQKNSIAKTVATPGNLFIGAFTGIQAGTQNPYANRTGVRKAVNRLHGKKTKLGRKISKKEQRELQKKYGKNWRMAVQQDSQGYYARTSPRERTQIVRANKLDEVKVDFGGAFPEPSAFISSEYSRVPFGNRSDDPMDVEANFMGERGSGFTTKQHDPFDVNSGFGNNPMFSTGMNASHTKNTKSNPFEVGGLKL